MALASVLVDLFQELIQTDSEFKKNYGHKFKKAVASCSSPALGPTESRAPSKAVRDSPRSPSPAIRPSTGPRSPTLSEEAQIPPAKSDSRPNSPMELAPLERPTDYTSDGNSTSASSDEYQVVTGGKRKKKSKVPSQATKAKKIVAATPTASPQFSPCPSPLPSTSTAAVDTPVPATTSPRQSRPPSPMDASTSKKQKPPPPIYLQDKAKWNDVSKSCDQRKISYSSARACQQGIRIQVPTAGDYRALTRFLKVGNISFHTYTLPEDTPTRVIIRRIPKEIPTEEIREDLLAQKVPVTAVHRLHKARGGQQYDMVLVVCSHTEGLNPIFKITTVCSLSGISIEKPFRPHLVGQCHRCQLYGHSQTNCFATPRCVKCTGDHGTQECPRPKDRTQCTEPPSCVLCGQVGHPANYRGCPKAPKLAPKMAKRFDARQKRESPSVKVPSAQIPSRLAPQRPSPWGLLNHQKVASQPLSVEIPALMDLTIPAPTPSQAPVAAETPEAPKSAQTRRETPSTSALTRPPPVAPSGQQQRYQSVSNRILSAYSIWMSPEARALDAELRNPEPQTPAQIDAIFNRHSEFTRVLDSLVFVNGQWVHK